MYKVAYIVRVSLAKKKLRPYKTISSFIAPLFVRRARFRLVKKNKALSVIRQERMREWPLLRPFLPFKVIGLGGKQT